MGAIAELASTVTHAKVRHFQAVPKKVAADKAAAKKLKTGDDVVFEVVDPKHPDQGINYIGGTLQ